MASQHEIEKTAKIHGINLEVDINPRVYKFKSPAGDPVFYTMDTGEANGYVLGYLAGYGYNNPQLENGE